MFAPYLEKWSLQPDGERIVTRSSLLLPVRWRGLPAMLKVAREEEEKRGHLSMGWWAGRGAAEVYAAADDALLVERSVSRRSLFHMAMTGSDEAATQTICRTVAALHAPRDRPVPDLIPLESWFAALAPAARTHGGVLAHSLAAAEALFSDPYPAVVLHGDIHHGNILDFGARGWLAIDPKPVYGDPGYDYANLFCNPELAVVTEPGRLQRHLAIVAVATGLAPRRILSWVLAYAGLSAAWFLEDDDDFDIEGEMLIARIAAAELDK
ncbi:aminoglycoside phosphotransferase family protein [Ensifer sp. 4252]|uniref:aminoglycoside phosphotransferase family protein n=1 Tax=Ensifer sp. 4252 TaxID=3373915 RepID=UPI003D2525C9